MPDQKNLGKKAGVFSMYSLNPGCDPYLEERKNEIRSTTPQDEIEIQVKRTVSPLKSVPGLVRDRKPRQDVIREKRRDGRSMHPVLVEASGARHVHSKPSQGFSKVVGLPAQSKEAGQRSGDVGRVGELVHVFGVIGCPSHEESDEPGVSPDLVQR